MTRILHIRVGGFDHSHLEETFAALDRGEIPDQTEPRLGLENTDQLRELLRPTNLELIEAVHDHEPGSIRALARCVDRAPSDVLPNVNYLELHGLLRLEQDGRAKRPVVDYDRIEVEIPLGEAHD